MRGSYAHGSANRQLRAPTTIGWSAKARGGSYVLAAATSSTSLIDSAVRAGSAYLYKVCAADGSGNCLSTYSNIALGATVTFPTDATITSIIDDPDGYERHEG